MIEVIIDFFGNIADFFIDIWVNKFIARFKAK